MGGTQRDVGKGKSQANTRQTGHELFPPSTPIQARVMPGQVTYYALTQNQIDGYARLGWVVTLLGAVAGMCLEAAFGCWLSLQEWAALASAARATVTVVMWVALALGIAVLVFVAILFWLKVHAQRGWLRSTVQLQP